MSNVTDGKDFVIWYTPELGWCITLDSLHLTELGNCKWEYIESLGKTVLVHK